jgi:hypothetical protein
VEADDLEKQTSDRRIIFNAFSIDSADHSQFSGRVLGLSTDLTISHLLQ